MRYVLVLGAMLSAIGCGPHHADHAAQSATACPAGGGISVVDAWARAAAPGQAVSAGYFTLCNGGASDDALVSATSSAAGVVELHESTTNADGVSSMRHLDELPAPAGGRVTLAPGGAHLMLMGLSAPLSEGGSISVTLRFKSGATETIDLPVRAGPPEAAAHHHHGG